MVDYNPPLDEAYQDGVAVEKDSPREHFAQVAAAIDGTAATLASEIAVRESLVRQSDEIPWGISDLMGFSPLYMDANLDLRGVWPEKIEARQREARVIWGVADDMGRSPLWIEQDGDVFALAGPAVDGMTAGAASSVPRIVIDGDSRVDQCMDGANTNAVGWLYWLHMLCGARFDFDAATDEGVGGQNTVQILAGIGPVLESDASIVIALMSTNDRTGGMTADASIANMTSYQQQVLDAGKRLIWIAELPRGDLDDDDLVLSGQQLAYHLRVREWLLAQASVPGVAVADPFADMVDPADTQARARQGVLKDSIHESPTGAYLIAASIVPILAQWLAPRRVLPATNADAYSADNPAGCLIDNPMLLGSGGTVGANATGAVATGWTVAATAGITVVAAKITDDEGRVWQEVTVSGTASQRQCATISIPLTAAGLTAGDSLTAVAEIEVEDGHSGLNGVPLILSLTGGATVEAVAGYAGPIGAQINMALPALPISGTAMTAAVAVPASPTGGSLKIGVYGDAVTAISAAVRIRAAAVRKHI